MLRAGHMTRLPLFYVKNVVVVFGNLVQLIPKCLVHRCPIWFAWLTKTLSCDMMISFIYSKHCRDMAIKRGDVTDIAWILRGFFTFGNEVP